MNGTAVVRTFRLASIVALLAPLLLLAACGKSSNVSLGDSDAGSQVEVKQGRQVTVRLASDSARGYGWFVTDPGPLEQTGKGAADGKPETTLTGSAEMQTFTFNAPSPGSGELAIEYRALKGDTSANSRSWSAEITVK
jgi:predicted secreted protein